MTHVTGRRTTGQWALRLVAVSGFVLAGGPVAKAQSAERTGASSPNSAVSAAADIAAWATQPATGPKGRPLPLAHSWNSSAFGGPYVVQLIKAGHHVLPTMRGPNFLMMKLELLGGDNRRLKKKQMMAEHWEPVLEFCNAHKLPFAMPSANWAQKVLVYQDRQEEGGLAEFTPEQSARMLRDGETTRYVDPFGPVERWREWGEFWMGNRAIQRFQEVYPDPPMVLLLDNHEGPRLRSGKQLDADVDRFVARYGEGPHDEAFKDRALREGYRELYAAMFDAARDALVSPAWKRALRFSAYNLLWDTGHVGYGGRPIFHAPDSERAKTWPHFAPFDGAACEVYDNDWEPGKQDVRLYSMQTEAMSYHAVQHRVYEKDPDFVFSLIAWDGGGVGNTWRGARREVGKAYRYATAGQQWDLDRYEGWMQFCLWMGRPRSFMEFRWTPPDPRQRDIFSANTWMAVVDVCDRVWNDERLAEYWRHGRAVPNPDQNAWWQLSDHHPRWMHELERWFLLTCDANPPRDEWTSRTELEVWAMALELGEAPERRWLIYAHAPRWSVAGATVTLPGHGDLALPHISRSGSFFEVREGSPAVTTLIQGGPAQIVVHRPAKFIDAGADVRFEAELTCPPDEPIESYEWRFDDGRRIEQRSPAPVTRAFEPGEHLVTVVGRTASGRTVTGQTVVWTGEADDEALLYDLSLDDPFAWRGPWKAARASGEEAGDPLQQRWRGPVRFEADTTGYWRMMTYRHVPNRGSIPDPVVSGGRFVNDPQRGGVLELTGDPNGEAIWLQLRRATVREKDGHPNRTIAMWFRADDVDARQVLFAEGNEDAGFNIYLERGRVYGGAWAPKNGWSGEWLGAPVVADQWHHVALVLDDATGEIIDGKLKLYLDGELIGAAPGRRVPRPLGVPRVGTGVLGDKVRSRFKDLPPDLLAEPSDESPLKPYVGRIDDFQYANAVRPPRR